MKYKKHFHKFVKQLDQRLAQGQREYGDKSFDRPISDLMNEMQQELLDVAGWGFIIWIKLEEMKNGK